LNQSYKNLEILCINDGSTDNSLQICEKYKNLDNKIIVIHKKNGGASSARNLGISVSKGTFITFVGSDDIIAKDMIKHLFSKNELFNADFSTCGLIFFG
jgi:glycosyltransferase involved in cell wall biosynthesis